MNIYGFELGWDAIVAISTFILALAAVVAIIVEWRRCRFEHAVDLIINLDDHFNDIDFRKIRNEAAKALLDQTIENRRPIDFVLGFFEKVGFLTRNGVIEERMVWHAMFYWIHRYYLSAKPHIIELRKIEKDITIYEDFEYLHSQLLKIEKKERKCSDPNLTLTETELEGFLLSELKT